LFFVRENFFYYFLTRTAQILGSRSPGRVNFGTIAPRILKWLLGFGTYDNP